MSAKSIIKSRKGYSVLLVVLGIIVAGIAMLPITKWYLSLHAGMEDLDTRFEMQSIVQDAWNRLLAEDYDETNERIKTNGNTFTEDIGSKWTLQYTYGSEGKYSAAQCTSATPDDDDQKCRKVTISLAAKDGSVKPYSINTTRVSSANGSEMLYPDWCNYISIFGLTIYSGSKSGNYTIPDDGYIMADTRGRDGGQAEIYLNGWCISYEVHRKDGYQSETISKIFIPVKKNDKVSYKLYIVDSGSYRCASAYCYYFPFKR